MISRTDIIERSVELYVREQMYVARAYPQDKVVMLDAYPNQARMTERLDRNYIAIGFVFDDGGHQAELGSGLKRRLHTIDFHVFGVSRVWARNLASVLRSSLETDGVINLLNPLDNTVIGYVDVNYVSAQHHPVSNPRPWEENVWITRLRVEDYHSASEAGN